MGASGLETSTSAAQEWERVGLLYSQCWEDVACARIALAIRPGAEVLAIGAAGDNVLALLVDEPRRILAVDVNPAQTALLELKLAAVRSLEPVQVGPFLGAQPDYRRLERYERVRPGLSQAASGYWDERPNLIEAGVIHVGRFERYLAVFRRRVMRFIPGTRAITAMLEARSLAEQSRVYASLWDSAVWRVLVRLCFGWKLLSARGRHPRMFAQAARFDVGDHYLGRARHALTHIPVRTNPFVTYMLTGGYDGPERMPLYLQPRAVARIAGLADRIEVANASVTDVLHELPSDSVDALYLSDVFELFDELAYANALREVARVGRDGARICYWNNLVPRQRPESMAGALNSHPRLATYLHRVDRAFLYSGFVVESVRGRQS